jgi:hypothetical protein
MDVEGVPVSSATVCVPERVPVLLPPLALASGDSLTPVDSVAEVDTDPVESTVGVYRVEIEGVKESTGEEEDERTEVGEAVGVRDTPPFGDTLPTLVPLASRGVPEAHHED